jgi:hypothetical protein
MSSLNATVWFRDTLDCNRLAEGFGRASERLGMGLTITCGSVQEPNSSEVWSKAISSFADYEYSGEAKWNFQGENGAIQGSITWPIINPGNIPGTIEFKVRWRERQNNKSFVFSDINLLVGVLYDFAFAVSATCLLVEPTRLPADIADERYERFKRLHSCHTLTSIDWICGVQSVDEQNRLLKQMHKPFDAPSECSQFDIFVFAPEPFDYKLSEDRYKVKSLEKDCLLI